MVNETVIYSKFSALHWLAVILFGSIIVWIDSSEPFFKKGRDPSKAETHAFAVGIAGMLWCIITMVVMRLVEARELFFVINALGMWIFWLANASIFTFDAPYKVFMNGWIASWLCAIASTYHFGAVSGWVRAQMLTLEGRVHGLSMNLTYVLGCILASIIVLVTSILECSGSCKGVIGYAVAVGAIGILLPMLLLIHSIPVWGQLFIAVLNLIWWMTALIILTMVEDVYNIIIANGFIATWLAAIFSILIAFPYLNAVGFESRRKFETTSRPATSNPRPAVSSSSGNITTFRSTGGNTVRQ